jgi:hypothetical protein
MHGETVKKTNIILSYTDGENIVSERCAKADCSFTVNVFANDKSHSAECLLVFALSPGLKGLCTMLCAETQDYKFNKNVSVSSVSMENQPRSL